MNAGRLEITTHIGCPINCVDCPQALLRSKYTGKRDMDFEEYKQAIDKVPANVRIDFSGMCEPFVNPHCADMILYAAEKGHPLALYTTLQGATLEDLQKIAGVGFEVITIHIPDKDNRSTFKITQDYLEVLHNCNCVAYSCHGNIDDRVIPYLLPGKQLITFMHDRAGNVEGRPHSQFEDDQPIICCNCGRDLNHNVLLPDGTVLLCCMDYGMEVVLGNLFNQAYEDLFISDAAVSLRQRMEHGPCLCRKCTNARWIVGEAVAD